MNKITVEQLEELDIFKNISKTSFEKLANFSEVKKYKAGSHVFRDKEKVTTLYVVINGRASLYKLDENGHKRVVFIFGKGKMINDVILMIS